MTAIEPKTVAIIQSSYIPWKGYFDIIDQSDSFILLDDVQYTKRDWRSRNKIPTLQGEKWLTIPVHVKGKYHQKICDVEVSDDKWFKSHWGVMENAYRKAPFFSENKEFVRDLYMTATQNRLSEVNFHFLKKLCEWLDITTQITWSMDYAIDEEDATERLALLCAAENATTYLSGPAAQSYLDESNFNQRGMTVRYMDYGHALPYPQLQDEFNPYVSVLDMIFNCGDQTMPLIRENRPSLSRQ
jgi:hypothetical protein